MTSAVRLILYSVSVLGAWGMNVDIDEPVIRGLPDQYASASQDFGYAAVLHLLSVPDPQAGVQEFVSQARASGVVICEGGIIVGAPKGSVSSLATGLVYSCPLTPGSCELMTNNTGELAVSMLEGDEIFNVSNPMYEVEQKEGQLLGASMASSGELFMACAPLYTEVREEQLWYRGKCFFSDRSLQNFTSFVSCESQTPDTVVQCSAGLSIAGASTSEGFLLGVPTYIGLGRIIEYENGRLNEDITGGQVAQLAQRGYQVAYGHITRTDMEQYVTVEYGADAVLGRVIVIDPDKPAELVRTAEIDGPILTISPTVMISRPAGIAVGFGFALATAKISSKDYDSILVSAPFASEGYEQGEVGKVYVYHNDMGTLIVRNPTELLSTKASFGRFGSAIVNMGDITRDGYDDIAVSAPYEDSGVVYIYHSRADASGLDPQYAQRIVGSNLNTGALEGLVGFGTTLSSGVDVDGNKYNDLLVGSFESQTVVVLRTRPIANVNTTFVAILRGVNQTLNLDVLECGENPCFDVEVCFTVEPTEANGTPFEGDSVDIQYTLVLEPERAERGFQQRSFFLEGDTEVGTLETFVMVRNNHVAKCFNHTVRIYKGASDREDAFVVQLQVEDGSPPPPPTDGNQSLTDLNLRPVLVTTSEQSIAVEPEKNCGEDGVCMPLLSVKVLDVTYADRFATFRSTFVAGETEQITIQLQVNNLGEDSFNTILTATYNGEVFGFSQLVNVSIPNCIETQAEDGVTVAMQCSIANPLRSNNLVLPALRLNVKTKDREFTEPNFTMTFNVTTDGLDLNVADNFDSKVIIVNRLADLRISGITVPDQALLLDSTFARPDTLTSLSQLGPSTAIQVFVFNAGPSLAPGATLNISWPLSTTSGSYILYPSSLTADNGVNCSMEHIDPERFNSPNRQRRQATGVEGVAIVGDLSLDCNDTAVECVIIVCTLGSFPSDEILSVTINSSLDVNYFTDKSNMNVRIPVEATVSVLADYPIDNPTNGDTLSSTVVAVYSPDTQTTAAEIPIWVYIVPIVIAVILLGILALVLYLCGAFRRKHHHRKETHPTTQVEEVAMTPRQHGEGSPSAEEKKAAEAEGDDEPDAISKSASLTSIDDIAPQKPKTPETDV